MNKHLLILLLLGIGVHFAFFGYPNQTVFDEVHFGKFVSGYYPREYYFDIHPPLGKLLIAGFGKLFDFRPEFSFAEIGDKFPDSKYMALRFLPSLAGSFLPAVIFLLALQLRFSRRSAFVAGILIAFENSLLVQTRFMLMDGFLILFGFLSLLFYFKSRSSLMANGYLLLAALFAGLAISIKWTGLTFIALPILIEAREVFINLSYDKFINLLKRVVFFIFIPFIIYFLVFALHFSLLPKSGPGDAFMSQEFHQKNVLKKFVELNVEMYRSNQRLTADHPYSSKWYEWPFMTRPIFYWVDSTSSPQVSGNSRIYLLGNPVIWWASTIAVILATATLIKLVTAKPYNTPRSYYIVRLEFLLGGYFLNFLPFIGIKRVMFLYHYLAALVFAILILVYLIEKWFDSAHHKQKSDKIFAGLVIASMISFIYFAPLTYGLKLSSTEYEKRIWLPSWK